MLDNRLRTGLYSLCHFLVDFACAYLLFARVAGRFGASEMFLVYNFCAFAMQMPLGLLADKINRNAPVAAAGIVLVAAAFFLKGWALAIVLGIGNSLFHLGGGLDTLNLSHKEKRCAPLGVFVSTGAFGIYLGSLLGKGRSLGFLFPHVLLLVIAFAVLFAFKSKTQGYKSGNVPMSMRPTVRYAAWIFAGLFFVVVLRSLVGLGASYPWKGEGIWGLLLVCSTVLGKALGGFLADRIGLTPACLISLGLSALLFPLAGHPAAGILAVLLFNMSMPMTLYALSRLLPGAKGFGFGALTFALFLGFLPVYFRVPALTPLACAFLALLSLLVFLPSLKGMKGQC